MTREEILAMEAGKNLDIRVAKDVMGCKFVRDEIFEDIQIYDDGIWVRLEDYSKDESTALSISERLEEYYNIKIDFGRLEGRWEANFHNGGINYYYPDLRATSLPEAICKVALIIAHSEKGQGVNGDALYNGTSWLEGILKKEEKDNLTESKGVGHGELLNNIIEIELDMFRHVRTSKPSLIQESPKNFRVMREMIHSVFSIETLESYLEDLHKAKAEGRNFLTEKYARMQNLIPPLRINPVIGDIIKIEGQWMRQLSEKYPRSFKGASAGFEKFLSSELETLSDKTLELYHRDISGAEKEGRNLGEERYTKLFQRSGYNSISEVEDKAETGE